MKRLRYFTILSFLFLIVIGCSSENIHTDELEKKLFTLNSETAIIDVLIGKVDRIDPTTGEFLGSKRNTVNSEVNGILNELHTMEFSDEKLEASNYYYLLKFEGQMIDDISDTFEIYLYVNPDNYNIYLDKIQLSNFKSPVVYSRLYRANNQVKQYVEEILRIN